MMAAGALFLLGCGLTAAGTLWSGLYDIGILVVIVAAIGVVVRAGDQARVCSSAIPRARRSSAGTPCRPGCALRCPT
jgi:hypothetical protein